MGQITTGIGLISGLPIADIIDQLIAIEARPKEAIEQRNTVLNAQQAAYQEVSAQMLNLKLSAGNIATRNTFNAKTAASSNELVLLASTTPDATPGNYSFRVNRLVSSQQTVTRGFADTNTSFVGAGTMTFESAGARLDSMTRLDELNGGAGVTRGSIRVTDRLGNTAAVDLSTAVTIDDVIDTINSNLTVNVLASVEGDHLVITDNTGASASNLIIANLGTGTTATTLGIVGNDATGTITGTQINSIGVATSLASLNDGNGVRRSLSQDDFRITSGDASTYDIDIASAATVGDVIDLINDATGGQVTAEIGDDGVSIKLTDAGGGGATFAVTALNSSGAAADLGLLDDDSDGDTVITGDRLIATINSKLLKYLNGGSGLTAVTGFDPPTLTVDTPLADLFNGAGLTTTALIELDMRDRDGLPATFINVDALTTVGDLIDAVDNGLADLTMTIEGNALRVTDNTGGGGNLRILDASGAVAAELGIAVDAAVDTVLGVDTEPLPLPNGLTGPGELDITDASGASATVDLINARSVSDVLDAINNAGIGVTASLNAAGNGILITDTTGVDGDLVIADVTGGVATGLGIVGTFSDGAADSGNLQFQYVSEATTLAKLGVTRGRFIIRDSAGASAKVDLTQGNEVSLKDVIDEINSRGLQINARINDNGDGILIEDLGPGSTAIQVEEDGSTTAADLGLLGSADSAGDNLDGSLEKTLTISAVDTVTGATLLDDLNSGDGVGTAGGENDLKFTTADGNTFEVDLSALTTVQEVLDAINTAGGGSVTAAINGQATGMKLTDNTVGNAEFTVEDVNDSDAADDLGINAVDNNGDGIIVGGAVVDLTTLQDLVERINDGNYGVTAAIVNDGSAGSPYRLSISADKTGSAGAFIFDDGALDFSPTTLNDGQDSIVFYGGSDPSQALLVTATSNSLTDVIPGATIDLLSTSDQPVQVTISEDDDSIVADVRQFVETFNAVVDVINKYDTFNSETEQRGLLLGDSALVTIRNEIYRAVTRASNDLSSQFRTLSAVGVRVGTGARLTLNESTLRAALQNDREAVQALFTLTGEEEDDDGETITTSIGVGARINDLLKRLTDSEFGPISTRVDALNQQVEFNNDRLEDLDERLEQKRARLEAEFTAMERALAQLQTQSNALASFQPVLQTARDLAQGNNNR